MVVSLNNDARKLLLLRMWFSLQQRLMECLEPSYILAEVGRCVSILGGGYALPDQINLHVWTILHNNAKTDTTTKLTCHIWHS